MLVAAALAGETVQADDIAAFAKDRVAISRRLKHREAAERIAGLQQLAEFPIADAARMVIDVGLKDGDESVRRAAYETLLRFKDSQEVCQAFIDTLNKDARRKRVEPSTPLLLAVLLSSGVENIQQATQRYLEQSLATSRDGVLFVAELADNLGAHGGAEDVAPLLRLAQTRLHEQQFVVRRAVAQALTMIPETPAIDALVALLDKAQGEVRADMVQHLVAVTGQELGLETEPWVQWWSANKATFTFPAVLPRRPQRTFGKPGEYQSYYGIPIYAQRVVFIIDNSGSMAGPRMEAAKRELVGAIKGLRDTVYFGIIVFNSTVRPWQRELVPADTAHKADAANFVERLLVTGQTASYDALDASFVYDAEAVYFLTDGAPTTGKIVNPPDIVTAITKGNRARRETIYTIGIGVGDVGNPFDTFLRTLAEQNYGDYKRVDE